MNPFTRLDTLLADYASERTRQLVHSAILILAGLVALWQAAEGNWTQFAAAVLGGVYAEANRANTATEDDVSHLADDPDFD